jgi:hypothetical protein
MAMFVQGFWFGLKLVSDGKIGAGNVMAVFWACLIVTSNLQICIPQFIILAQEKFAIVALLSTLIPTSPPQHLRLLQPLQDTHFPPLLPAPSSP